jgi:hypothetical protein
MNALVLSLVLGAAPADDEAARAAVAIELAKLRLKAAPAGDGPAPAGHEWVKPAGGAWELRKLAAPGGGAAPTFRSGGCGCTASANCGAPFCKSRGGAGCPASCPIKQK